MSHLRQQIRERIATTCTSLTTTGSNVFQSRFYQIQASELPCLLVYTTSEDVALNSDYATMGTVRNVSRQLNVVIEGFSQLVSNADDTLDTICKEVEVAMAGDIGINNLAIDSFLNDVDLSYEGEGQQPLAIARMTYSVIYRNAENDPENAA